MTNPTPPAEPGEKPKHALFYVGTLVYSRAGLAWVFMWLLWGDFCFTMMEQIVPSIVPLRLRELDAPNWVLGVVLVTVPAVMNVLLKRPKFIGEELFAAGVNPACACFGGEQVFQGKAGNRPAVGIAMQVLSERVVVESAL